MQPQERQVLILNDGAFVVYSILGVIKGIQPATLQTPDIPYNQIMMVDGSQAILMYETVESRDEEYKAVLDSMVGAL